LTHACKNLIFTVTEDALKVVRRLSSKGRTASKRERCLMRERLLTIPEIVLIAGTRVALGAGLGLLIADKLNGSTRKGAGWALLIVGALTTVPLVIDVVAKGQLPDRARPAA
jgi:hypothetical protein